MSGGKGIVLAPDGSVANADPLEDWHFVTGEELPPGWKARHVSELDALYLLPKRNLRVMLSVMPPPTRSAGAWIHLSYSHPRANPSHKTTVLVKKLFIGENREAIAVYPPKHREVNIMDFCLHLWAPIDPRDRTWPKFETFIDGVGLSI